MPARAPGPLTQPRETERRFKEAASLRLDNGQRGGPSRKAAEAAALQEQVARLQAQASSAARAVPRTRGRVLPVSATLSAGPPCTLA